MKADAQTEAAVMAAIEQFKQAYSQRDLGGLLALFAPDPDVVVFGTGADEKCVGVAELQRQFERDWAQSESFSWDWTWSSVSAAGSVAWAAVEALGHARVGGQELHMPLRLTAVFEQRGARWLWVQGHLSLPASGQAEGESFPVS